VQHRAKKLGNAASLYQPKTKKTKKKEKV